jgi:WD40 repeat protein
MAVTERQGHSRIFVLACAAIGACAGTSAHHRSPQNRSAASTPAPPTPACQRARRLRAASQAHSADGKLDRTVREIAQADRLCPAEAKRSWATALDALRELGKDAEVAALGAAIEVDPSAPPEARTALARARVSQLTTPTAPDELVAEALDARRRGQLIEAQKLLDRAGAAYEAQTRSTLTVDPPPLGIYPGGVSWSPDGKWLAVLDGPFASLFSATNFVHRFRFESPGYRSARTAKFSEDGSSVLVELCENEATTRCDLRVHRLTDGALRCSVKGPRAGWPRSLSADGSLLADSFTTTVWDVSTCTPRLKIGGASSLAFSRDGRWLAATGQLWDVQAGEQTATFEQPRAGDEQGNVTSSLAFSSDGKLLATLGADRQVNLWSVPEGRRVRRFPRLATPADVTIASFGARNLVLTTTDDYRAEQGAVWMLDALSGTQRRVLPAPKDTDRFWQVALSPDLSRIVRFAPLAGAPAELIELASGKRLQLPALKDPALAFSPDGGRLLLHSQGHAAEILDTTTGARLEELPLGHTASAGLSIVKPVALSNDGRLLVVGGAELSLWDLARGARRATVSEQAWHLAVSKTNRLAAAGFGLYLVDLERGVLTASIATNSRTFLLGFNAAGDRLATALENQTLRIFGADGAPLATFEGLYEVRDLKKLAFAPDDRSVELDGEQGSVRAAAGAAALSHSGRSAKDEVTAPPEKSVHCDAQAFGAGPKPAALAISGDCSTAAIGTHLGPIVVLRRDGRRLWIDTAHGVDAAFAQNLDGYDLQPLLDAQQWPEWLAATPVEPLGQDARSLLVCRAGSLVLPLAVCEERLLTSGLTSGLFQPPAP